MPARSAAPGFAHGVFTTPGIVIGDMIFILAATAGLAALAGAMDGLFVLVKYLGGAYVIWLVDLQAAPAGRGRHQAEPVNEERERGHASPGKY